MTASFVYPTPAERGLADSGGVPIAWSRYGTTGPWALVMPTWNIVDARAQARLVAELLPVRRVLTYDPRGNGASGRPADGYGHRDHLADALAVMGELGIATADLVAISWGSNPAVLLAAEHPGRVRRSVLVGASLAFGPQEPDPDFWAPWDGSEGWGRFNADAWRRDLPGFIEMFMRNVFDEPGSEPFVAEAIGWTSGTTAEVLIAGQRDDEIAAIDLEPFARRVGSPVLFVHGTEDHRVPYARAEGYTTVFPDARVAGVEGGGHRPDITRPSIVGPIIRAFIDATSPPGAEGGIG